MIEGGGGSGFGVFPDIPRGSPGDIASAADHLTRAGDRMHDVAAGLRATVDGLGQGWSGDAAGRYRLAAGGLADVARDAARTYDECAGCVHAYGRALDEAQQTLRHLRHAYDDAVRRATTASGRITSLAAQLAVPDAPPHLAGELSAAQQAHGDALGDIGRILQRAGHQLDDFHRAERHAVSVLGGQDVAAPGSLGSPFAPGPGVGNPLGGGFGIPMGGLAPFDGLVRVNDPWNGEIPGLGTYWDGTHPSAEPVDDLTNAVLFAAGGVGAIGLDTLRVAAREIVSSGLERAGLVGSRTAGRRAYQETFDEVVGLGRNGPLRAKSLAERMREGRAAGAAASADRQVAVRAARARALPSLIRGAQRVGVKVPQGLEDLAAHGYEYASQYKYRVVFRLLQLRGAVAGRGAAGAALARAIDRLLGGT